MWHWLLALPKGQGGSSWLLAGQKERQAGRRWAHSPRLSPSNSFSVSLPGFPVFSEFSRVSALQRVFCTLPELEQGPLQPGWGPWGACGEAVVGRSAGSQGLIGLAAPSPGHRLKTKGWWPCPGAAWPHQIPHTRPLPAGSSAHTTPGSEMAP